MNIKSLKHQAKTRLNPNAYRLTLIHTGISVAASVLVAVIGFLLTRQADTAVGLSGIGTRSILLTAQTVLTYAVAFLLPFWNLGYTHVSLAFARGVYADAGNLTEGFRRFFPALRTMLLRAALLLGVCFICIQTATILFMFTPFANRLTEAMMPYMGPTGTQMPEITPEMVESLLPTLLPVYILAAALFLGVAVLVLYRLRLVDLAIMDTATGAFSAFRTSLKATRGHLFTLVKLDLSFWWYYLLQLVAVAIAYGDLLPLPIPADVSYLVFTVLSALTQLLITWRFAPYVHTTLATAYTEWTIEN